MLSWPVSLQTMCYLGHRVYCTTTLNCFDLSVSKPARARWRVWLIKYGQNNLCHLRLDNANVRVEHLLSYKDYDSRCRLANYNREIPIREDFWRKQYALGSQPGSNMPLCSEHALGCVDPATLFLVSKYAFNLVPFFDLFWHHRLFLSSKTYFI